MEKDVLTTEKVEKLFVDCLFKDGENTEEHIPIKGITINVGFNPDRLEESKESIMTLLKELPETFMESKGGGMSFLNACTDKNGRQWTGFHQSMEKLFLLGIGIKKVSMPMPKELWKALPGGVPYFIVHDK